MSHVANILAEVPPQKMEQHVRSKIRAAAFRATRVFPGAVGQLLSRELLAWEEFGYRLDHSGGLIMKVVDQVLTAPLPLPTQPPSRVQ